MIIRLKSCCVPDCNSERLTERTQLLCKKKRESFRNMKCGAGTGWSHRTKKCRLWSKEGERKGPVLECGLGMHFAVCYATA